MKQNRFEFFNKEDGIIEDMNVSVLQQKNYLQNYLKGFITPGFIPQDNDLIGFDFKTSDFTLSQGTDINHLSMTIIADTVMAIDINGQVITIDTDTLWTISPLPSQSSGNINIDLSNGGAFSTVAPYDRWIWIKFKELRSETVNDTRVDYDGGTQYPVKNIGYEIIITDTDVNPDPIALFVVHVNVDSVQTYFTEPSTGFPTDPLRLKASIKDSAVWALLESVTFKPTTYEDGIAGNPKRYSLKDHINAIGTGTVSPNNPHGIAPKDIPTYDSAELTMQGKVIRNGFFPEADGMSFGVNFGSLFNSITNHIKIKNQALFFNGLRYEPSDLSQYNSVSGFVEIPFDTTTYPTSGYYKIHIPDGSTSPIFVATLETLAINLTSVYPYGHVNDNEIFVGFVYWDTTTPELRKTDKYGNTDGERLMGETTVGVLNPLAILPFRSPGRPDGKNLLMLPDGPVNVDINYASTNIPKCYCNLPGSSTAVITSNGSRIYFTINCTGAYVFRFIIPLVRDGEMSSLEPMCTARFTFNYNSSFTNFTSAKASLKVSSGPTIDLDIPTDRSSFTGIFHHPWVADKFELTVSIASAGTHTFTIQNFSIVEGIVEPIGNRGPNHIVASQVVLNTNFAKYQLPAIVEEMRPTATNQNLDRIIYRTPQVTKLKQTSGNTQDSNANFTTYGIPVNNFSNIMVDDVAVNNIEIWPIQGLMVDTGGIYVCQFDFDNTKYELVSVSMNKMLGDYSMVGSDNMNDWVQLNTSNFIYNVSLTNLAGAPIIGKHIYCIGTLILRRKAA